MKRWLAAIGVLAVVGAIWLLAAGDGRDGPSAYFVSPSLSDEEALRARSTSRWEGLISGDMQRAYLHATPAYRATYDLVHYENQYARQITRESVDVHAVTIDPEDPAKAEVVILLHYSTSGFQPGTRLQLTSRNVESWVKEDGQWWFIEPR